LDTGPYKFADLEEHQNLISAIAELENKMKQELGKDVTLIAYSKGESIERA
jgi:hypothetical protein